MSRFPAPPTPDKPPEIWREEGSPPPPNTDGIEANWFPCPVPHPGPSLLLQCPSCSKCFLSRTELNLHEAFKHRGEKLFVCEECGHRASSRNGLQMHVKAKHRCRRGKGRASACWGRCSLSDGRFLFLPGTNGRTSASSASTPSPRKPISTCTFGPTRARNPSSVTSAGKPSARKVQGDVVLGCLLSGYLAIAQHEVLSPLAEREASRVVSTKQHSFRLCACSPRVTATVEPQISVVK